MNYTKLITLLLLLGLFGLGAYALHYPDDITAVALTFLWLLLYFALRLWQPK